MMDDSSQTMPMLVANLSSGYSIDYGVLMLGVLICSLPTDILFLVLQKSFANGIVGAVKDKTTCQIPWVFRISVKSETHGFCI